MSNEKELKAKMINFISDIRNDNAKQAKEKLVDIINIKQIQRKNNIQQHIGGY